MTAWPLEWPQTFPSGVEELRLVVGFRVLPAEGIELGASLKSDAGEVPLSGWGTSWQFERDDPPDSRGVHFVMKAIRPSKGRFSDGSYQCTITLGGGEIALLNWSVGKP